MNGDNAIISTHLTSEPNPFGNYLCQDGQRQAAGLSNADAIGSSQRLRQPLRSVPQAQIIAVDHWRAEIVGDIRYWDLH